MGNANLVYEFEGDTTQALASFDFKSRMFRFPRRVRLAYGRVLFTKGDLADYWDLVEARNDVIARNLAKIAEGSIDGAGGRIGGGFWFSEEPIAADTLETVPAVPVYSGDLTLVLEVYKAGTLAATKTIYHDKPFRLGVSGKDTDWEYELVGNVDAVHQIDIASSIREMRVDAAQE